MFTNIHLEGKYDSHAHIAAIIALLGPPPRNWLFERERTVHGTGDPPLRMPMVNFVKMPVHIMADLFLILKVQSKDQQSARLTSSIR